MIPALPAFLFFCSVLSGATLQAETTESPPFTPPPPLEEQTQPEPEKTDSSVTETASTGEMPEASVSAPPPEETTPPATPVLNEKKNQIPVEPTRVSAPVNLKDFDNFPPFIQTLVLKAFELHGKNLGYKFGSADPGQGGMDCSGTVYYLLRELGWKNVPRQSDAFYRWAWQAGHFYAVNGTTFNSFEWAEMKPGDLLFWTGTYAVSKDRDPAISHVMIYLGEEEKTGRKLMFGASEGRRYEGKSKNGVGIFDFYLPEIRPGSAAQARFVGYARIPGSAEKVAGK